MTAQFNTITGDDWRRSLKSARQHRAKASARINAHISQHLSNMQTDLFAPAPDPAVPTLPPAWLSTDLAELPCLSIRQPWAWLIVRPDLTDLAARSDAASKGLMKDIENRCWPTKFRGRFLVHAAKGCTRKEHEDAESFAWCNDVQIPLIGELKRGGIVGVAEIVDCVDDSDSDWFVGEFGFVLRNVQPLDFHPCAGALGFFKLTKAA